MNRRSRTGWILIGACVLLAPRAFCATPAETVRAKWEEAEALGKKFNPDVNVSVVKLLEAAAQAARRSGDPKLVGEACEKLGSGYFLKLTQPRKAVGAYEEALAAYRSLKDAEGVYRVLRTLAFRYQAMEDYGKAIKAFEELLTLRPDGGGKKELAEAQREALSPAEKQNFFSAKVLGFDRTEPYEGLVRCLAGQGDADGAFHWSENLKARLLAEAIGRGKSGAGFTLPPDLAARQESLETRIRGLRAEMDGLFRSGDDAGYAAKEEHLRAARSEMELLVSDLRRSHPEYAATRFPTPLKASDVALEPGETLLAFEVTGEKSFLFLLDGATKKASAREIPLSRDALERLALQYRDYFEGVGSAADLGGFKAAVGKKLHDALFGAAPASLPETASVIIVPDETLGLVPFESLPVALPKAEKMGEGDHGPFPMGVTYLGDRFPVSYAQSATSLSLLRSLAKAGSAGEGALAVVDPVFSVGDSRIAGSSQPKQDEASMQLMGAIKAWERMGAAGTRRRAPSGKAGAAQTPGQAPAAPEEDVFPRLSKTHEIGESFKTLFGPAATVLEGSEARKERVIALPFGRYRFVAFGTHGILDGDIPYIREPALVLSQVGVSEGKDGFLTMSEVMGLKVPADVVALTACRTGVGRRLSGEGVLGMGRAFQYAGASSVLMSMWSVEEGATVAMTNSFFGHLKSGKPAGEALRLARADVRRKGYEHPFYWSAFVLVSR